MYNSDSVVAFSELLESMGASLMDFRNGGGQQKQAAGTDLEITFYISWLLK